MNEPKKRGRPPKVSHTTVSLAALGSSKINPAQLYAERVWNGQSPDVPRVDRLERVRKALEGQGLSMDGVKL